MVSARIIDFSQAVNGNIFVNVEYTLPDNTKVINQYNAQYTNFIGKDALGIRDFIRRQIEYQCERYLEAYAKNNINTEIIANSLDVLKNETFSRDKVVWKITDAGEQVTEQLKEENIKGIVVKKISIDENGVIIEETI